MMGKEQYVREMWEYFCQERVRVKRFREKADEEKQAGIQGQWQQESPAREYLEQVKRCDDNDCTQRMMKQGYTALKRGDWEEYKSIFRAEVKATEWAFHRIKEAFEQVAQDEARKVEHRAGNYDQKHGLLAAHHRASWRTRRSHDVLCVSELQQFYLGRLHLVGLWDKRAQQLVVRSVERNTIGSNQTGLWSYKQVKVSIRPRSSKHMQYVRAVRKFDQCGEVAGEPARRWRGSHTEHRDKPR